METHKWGGGGSEGKEMARERNLLTDAVFPIARSVQGIRSRTAVHRDGSSRFVCRGHEQLLLIISSFAYLFTTVAS